MTLFHQQGSLENNFNLSVGAKCLYMHRNTINYRMNKIKELLNCQLDTFEEKVPYMLSYYIKKVLEEKK